MGNILTEKERERERESKLVNVLVAAPYDTDWRTLFTRHGGSTIAEFLPAMPPITVSGNATSRNSATITTIVPKGMAVVAE